MQAKDSASAEQLVKECQALEAAGAVGIILELIPESVAGRVAKTLEIPTIGIGAGSSCDGQVQVWHDLIGLETHVYRHAVRLCDAHKKQTSAVEAYKRKVVKKEGF